MTSQLSRLVHDHFAAIIISLAIGAVCIAPQLYFMKDSSFQGIQMIGADAEDHYVARIQEVYDGYPTLGNTYIAQKNTLYTIPGLGENIIALAGKAIGLASFEINLISKFVFPFLCALLIYAFVFLLFGSRLAALIAAPFVMFGTNLTGGISSWLGLLHGASNAVGFVAYGRPINPEVSSLFLFAGMLFFYKTFFKQEKPQAWQSLLLGCIAGISLYVSPFVSTFLCTTIALSFPFFIYKKQMSHAAGTIMAGTATVVAVMPFVLNYLQVKASPYYLDFALREGLAYGHQFTFSLWLVLLLGAAIFAWPKEYKTPRPFFIIAILAIWILTEQQTITGISVQPSHYHWYLTIPFIAIIASMYAIWASRLVLRKPLLVKGLAAFGIAVLFYNAVLVQIHSYQFIYPEAVSAQRYASALEYLKLLSEASIWADPAFSSYIPIYTHHDAPNSSQAANYLIPRSFFEERLFLNYRLRGIKPEDALSTMQKERAEVSSAIYALYWRQQSGSFDAIPDSEISRLANGYVQTYSIPLTTLMKELGINIVAWDKSSEPGWPLSQLPTAKKIFEANNIEIYTL